MKTRLLRQLRKDAKESIYIEYPSFKDACDNNFTDETPSMIIVTGINSAMMDLEDNNKDYALIDGIKFTFNTSSWQYESESISITKAKSLYDDILHNTIYTLFLSIINHLNYQYVLEIFYNLYHIVYEVYLNLFFQYKSLHIL